MSNVPFAQAHPGQISFTQVGKKRLTISIEWNILHPYTLTSDMEKKERFR